MYKKLVFFTALLALCVVVLGAYVRLSDAGLGCPDWPGCYGKISPHHAAEDIAQAQEIQPGGPVSTHKAWKEMVHRYFAGTLGLLIGLIALLAWLKRKELDQSPILPTLLVGLVVFQALLGMWTVTERLKPFIVTSHLLGGLATLALLVWLALKQQGVNRYAKQNKVYKLKIWGLIGLLLVSLQIILGGWVSTNYAALACSGFPQCNGLWWPNMDYSHAFRVVRELGMTVDGDFLSREGLVAIHWTHRLGAYVVFLYLVWLGLKLLKMPSMRGIAQVMLLLLFVQVGLGISNVLMSLPLPVAVSHNLGAALLLIVMVNLNFRLNKAT
ncbi:COX15/CtaA family protein [Sulfurirhabdus autotrophica]|uniref:Cytochrome c oxidase assembly protein subunit 15 n=1 Tax=Sulfurirhabdus autotrophica TaxID=1706046 RepID=A0A4R3Y3R1_9PROT|nr:COX15/CtaA family protein [Sulfurirhabdus autotrophica]TCV84753.1 cytochrome c oxidase assembly protein subunit 15 [Sulfurirhabdus autotrophica]